MTKITYIPGEIVNAAIDEHGNRKPVTRTHNIFDDNKNKNQAEINVDIDNSLNHLNDKINVVNKQDIISVDALPDVATADPKKIYRVVGEDNYTDYMVNANGDSWKKLATYNFPGIDNEPTTGSDNLVKSGGVADKISELEIIVNGDEKTLDLTSPTSGWSYVECKIKKGVEYTYTITRKDSSSSTCQFRTFSTQQTAGAVDVLNNLPYGQKEIEAKFTASNDANYIGIYSATAGVNVEFYIYSSKGIDVGAETKRAIERENAIEKQIVGDEKTLSLTSPDSGFSWSEYSFKKGVNYSIVVKRLDDSVATCQFKTTTAQQTSAIVDSLPNLPYGQKETTFNYTASNDANYIGIYASTAGVKVSISISSVAGLKQMIDAEKQRAIAKENALEYASKAVQTRNAISNIIDSNNIISTINWFFIDGLIPANSNISRCSFIARGEGRSMYGIWKYADNNLTLMETGEVNGATSGTEVSITAIVDRKFDYNAIISFKNITDVTGCVGIKTDVGNRLFFSATNRTNVGAVVPFSEISTSNGSLCVRVTYTILLDNTPKDTTNQGILEVGANKQYKTIQEACLVANSGNTILVYPGLYKEQVHIVGKEVHIVGLDKYTCILEDDSSNYYTPPLEINCGSVCNMTIRETAKNPPAGLDDIIIPGTGLSAKNMAYCIHVDWDFNRTNKKFVLDNCILWNANRPCLGSGLHQDETIEVTNCVMYSGVSDEGKGRGALYCHAAADGATTQNLILKNNDIECADGTAMLLRGYNGGEMYVEAINNVVYSRVNGKDDSAIEQNFGTGMTLKLKSFGNNVSVLNKL